MCEVGVYRISGVSGEIQRLKKAFEKSMAAMLSKLCVIIRRQIFSWRISANFSAANQEQCTHI